MPGGSRTKPGRRRRMAGDVSAIFVHAGAGYHSLQNEKIHLQACEDACKSAMAFLNNGGSAVEAVEIAIRSLEDKEITNAGFGSNLTMHGEVECDATIVDHFGRSGAVGAVGKIRNPIHVARLILEHSTQPLSLRRVPPNLLVGAGATDFAAEKGVPVLPPDALISQSAHDRYQKWRADIERMYIKSQEDQAKKAASSSMFPNSFNENSQQEQEALKAKLDALPLDDPSYAQLAHCWNESQPYSPCGSPVDPELESKLDAISKADARVLPHNNIKSGTHLKLAAQDLQLQRSTDSENHGVEGKDWRDIKQGDRGNDGQAYSENEDTDNEDDQSFVDDDESSWLRASGTRHDVSMEDNPNVTDEAHQPPTADIPMIDIANGPLPPSSTSQAQRFTSSTHSTASKQSAEDDITDTVGAIAVDCLGNIAAGSSSGGIGMKHGGRVGPAALVGIGTAVIPIDPTDTDKTCVGTVTSGTGEHMATTMAATTCANRLYRSDRKGRQGGDESTDEDGAMKGFVERDFMGHPSVRHSHSAGAIGILGVKKTTEGVWLYFAHNTDSFAVGSMSSLEYKPKSVMSRGRGDGRIITGGRVCKHTRANIRHSSWPASKNESATPPSKRAKKLQLLRNRTKTPSMEETEPQVGV